jgi:hypothetical protein
MIAPLPAAATNKKSRRETLLVGEACFAIPTSFQAAIFKAYVPFECALVHSKWF